MKARSNALPEESENAIASLNAFENVLDEADLFAHELANGLVPDGNSATNPGLGPMDFNEWREWKRQKLNFRKAESVH